MTFTFMNQHIAMLEAVLLQERTAKCKAERERDEARAEAQAKDPAIYARKELTLQLQAKVAELEAALAAERQRVADLERAHENQRVAINQVLMSKRNEHASWDEIVDEIRQLQVEAERVAELEAMNSAMRDNAELTRVAIKLRTRMDDYQRQKAEAERLRGIVADLEQDRERLDDMARLSLILCKFADGRYGCSGIHGSGIWGIGSTPREAIDAARESSLREAIDGVEEQGARA